jgi:hypothetical protein
MALDGRRMSSSELVFIHLLTPFSGMSGLNSTPGRVGRTCLLPPAHPVQGIRTPWFLLLSWSTGQRLLGTLRWAGKGEGLVDGN